MNVKVCNFRSNEFGADFRDSVNQTGFAVVTHHGIDQGFIQAIPNRLGGSSFLQSGTVQGPD
jgi:hypothetical protein